MFPKVALPFTQPVGIVIAEPDLPVASAGFAALQTCQVTAVFCVPATAALNCSMFVSRTGGESGVMETVTLGDELPPHPAIAHANVKMAPHCTALILNPPNLRPINSRWRDLCGRVAVIC